MVLLVLRVWATLGFRALYLYYVLDLVGVCFSSCVLVAYNGTNSIPSSGTSVNFRISLMTLLKQVAIS